MQLSYIDRWVQARRARAVLDNFNCSCIATRIECRAGLMGKNHHDDTSDAIATLAKRLPCEAAECALSAVHAHAWLLIRGLLVVALLARHHKRLLPQLHMDIIRGHARSVCMVNNMQAMMNRAPELVMKAGLSQDACITLYLRQLRSGRRAPQCRLGASW